MATERTANDIGSKKAMKALVVGRNKCGKSSLINALVGKKITEVGDAVNPNPHGDKLLMKRDCSEHGIPVIFYDTRGYKDYDHKRGIQIPDSQITEAIVAMRSTDVVLICHKLLEPEDDKSTSEILQSLVPHFDDGMIERCIFVFTFSDEINGLNDERQRKMITKEKENNEKLKKILKEIGHLREENIDSIPSCVTCCKGQLPTNDDWVEGLWELIAQRCRPEARKFMSWRARNYSKLLVGGVVAGLAIGAVFGLLPGLGTIAGVGVLAYLYRNNEN